MHTIDFGTIKQASEPTIAFTWPLLDSHTPTDWSDAALSGTLKNLSTKAVTAITGALVVVDGATRSLTWAMSAEDTGTAGTYQVTLLASVDGTPIYTLYGSLTIQENPEVNAIGGPGLVGITAAAKTWLTAEQTATEAASDGNLLQSDGTNSEDSGIAAVDVLVRDASIVAVSTGRDLASSDAGKILECNGTFSLNCPNGLDVGFQVALVNVGSGTITITATTTLQSKAAAVTITSQYAVATLYHRGSNVWLLAGDIG